MKRLTLIRQTLAAACLLSFAQFASSAVISFDLDTTLANVADTFTVDLVWTGGVDEYLGDFDLDIAYNDGIVQYDSANFDPDFGLDSFGLGIYDDSFSVDGLINLVGISFDEAIVFPDLQDNQDALGRSFVLATLNFTALAVGQTPLNLGINTLGDEFGDPRNSDLDNGRICVGPDGCGVAAVPEPATLPLILLGLLPGFLVMRRKRNA